MRLFNFAIRQGVSALGVSARESWGKRVAVRAQEPQVSQVVIKPVPVDMVYLQGSGNPSPFRYSALCAPEGYPAVQHQLPQALCT